MNKVLHLVSEGKTKKKKGQRGWKQDSGTEEDNEERSQRQKPKSKHSLNRSAEGLTLKASASQSFFTMEI